MGDSQASPEDDGSFTGASEQDLKWREDLRVSDTDRVGIGEHPTEEPEKAMAPHSSTLAWKIPWMEEPGRLPSMGSHRVRHD